VDLVVQSAERRGAAISAAGIDLRPVLLYNPRMLTVVFMVPALLGMIIQYQTIILTAAAIVRERELGSLEQLMVTPVRSWELMVGKIVPYAIIAEASAGMALVVGRFWFGVRIAGSLGFLFGVSLVFVLGSLGVGLLISTIARSQRQAQQFAQFLLLPALLLSGFLTTREAMPVALQYLSLFVPATYFLQVLRGVMLKGVGLDVLWPQIWPLAIFGAVVFGIAAALFQKRLG
jgi:drug efflux transport system permease protein